MRRKELAVSNYPARSRGLIALPSNPVIRPPLKFSMRASSPPIRQGKTFRLPTANFLRRGLSIQLYPRDVVPGWLSPRVYEERDNFTGGGLFGKRGDSPWACHREADVNGITVHAKFQLLICLLRCRVPCPAISQRVKGLRRRGEEFSSIIATQYLHTRARKQCSETFARHNGGKERVQVPN